MKKWNIYIIALLLLGACSDENLVDSPITKADTSELTVTLKFPQSADMTKALATPAEENRVNTLDILVFTEATTGNYLDDVLAYRRQVSGSEITSSGVNSETKTATIKVQNMPEDQRFILLANLPSGTLTVADTAGAALGTKKLSDIISRLTYDASPWQKDNLAAASDPAFPMWGQMANPEYKTITAGTSPGTITIDMIRTVARIDVGVDIYGTGDPALGGGKIFEITNVYLCDARIMGTIYPHNDYITKTDSIRRTEILLPNQVNNNVTNVDYVFAKNEGSSMIRTIYTAESDTFIASTNNPAFLVVKATYNGGDYYYRVDFAKNGKYVPLLRNHRYTINILGIRATGYATLADARSANPSASNPSLVFEIADSELNEVITNEKYYLAYSAKEIMVDWDQSVSFYAKTDFPGGVQASAGYTVTGIAGGVQTITGTLPENVNGVLNTFSITISAGALTRDIQVKQGAGSNSYITNGLPVRIPIKSADLDGTSRSSNYNTASVVWVDWTDGSGDPGNISPLVGNILTYTPPAGKTGNAVIAMKDAGGGILWSWHIWVTSYNPNTTTDQNHNNGFTFMDRNLGATNNAVDNPSFGLYYQWGRKDPFSMTSIPAFGTDTISGMNMGIAIQHPDTFYAAIAPPFDWIGSAQNNNLWNKATKEKGFYDPCPFGWRVPAVENDDTGLPWKGFSGNTLNGAVYPPAGYLDATSGTRIGTGQTYVWGGSARSQNAFVYNFTAGVITRATSAIRANAYPVRCVKDTK